MSLTAKQKKLMRRWVDALRSRKYKQGIGALRVTGPTKRSVDRYCCLGVLCDLHDPKRWNNDNDDDGFYPDAAYSYAISDSIWGCQNDLPVDVMREINLSSLEESVLIAMNDDGKKFHEIADYLEKKYLA